MKLKTLVCLSLVILVASLVPAHAQANCSGSVTTALTNWVDYRFDHCHTGFNPFERILSPANVGNLVPYKEYNFGAGIPAYSAPPVLVNGVVYVGANETLYAIKAATGVVLWSFKAAVDGYGITSPTVVNGIAYVAASNPSILYALNAQTGVPLWTYPYVAGEGGPPTVAGGLVYFSTGAMMLAFNARTGTIVWQWQKQDYRQIYTSASVADGAVYFGIIENDLYKGIVALDAASGQLLWDHTGYLYLDENTVAVNDGLVFFMSMLTMYALDAHTGAVVWTSDLGDSANLPLATANGVVYVGGFYTVYAFDEHTGTVVWTRSTGSDPAYDSIILANGVLYVATQSNVYALKASTGELLWEHDDAVDTRGSSPLVVNGVLYVATASNGLIYSFHLPQ